MNYQGYIKIPQQTSEWKDLLNLKTVKNWYVTEKVHGSCFCIVYDNKSGLIQYAKRKSLLDVDENFFGYKSILDDILPKINIIIKNVKKTNNNILQINIYGELFGGGDETPIQSGIYYSGKIHFYAFDISYMTIDGKEIYLDFEDSLILFKKSKILHAEPIAKFSKIEQALNYNYSFESTIFKKLHPEENLPNKFINNNKAEGVVIRSSHGRFLVKLKIKEFSESKYDENNYQYETMTPFDIYKKKALECLTYNRLKNAQSKYGEFEKYKDLILEELCLDILTEINGFHIYELKEWLNNQILNFIK